VYKIKKRHVLTTVLLVVSFVLIILLILTYMQNLQLKDQIAKYNEEYRMKIIGEINDFVFLIIDKVRTCNPVTLMAYEESEEVIGLSCNISKW